MVRLAAAFIAVCMAVIAASIGILLYLSAGLSGVESAVVAIAILTAFAVYNAAATRLRDRRDVSGQIADLSRGTADLARQVGELGRRVAAIEHGAAATGERARAAAEPLAAEIQELGGLVKQLAEQVASHDTMLAAGPAGTQPVTAAPGASEVGETPATIDLAELGEPEPERATSGTFKGMERSQILAAIRSAIEANRVDLYLQPVVSLPQRKVRYYEAMTRLRNEAGEVVGPGDFLSYAESGGLMPRIDNLLLFRCVQVVRRLTVKNREIGVFCNISATTLTDPEFFPQLSDFMQANRAIAPSLILEFAQTTMRAMGPIEQANLHALADLGFRFSLDRLVDLKLEPRELAEGGFRFVKVPAALLLNRVSVAASDIHPADFSDLLGRFGIDLIAEKIESEATWSICSITTCASARASCSRRRGRCAPRCSRGRRASRAGARRTRTAKAETAPPPRPDAPPVAPVGDPAAGEPRPGAERRTSILAQLARGMVRR